MEVKETVIMEVNEVRWECEVVKVGKAEKIGRSEMLKEVRGSWAARWRSGGSGM